MKKIITMVLAGISLFQAPAVFAGPIAINGDSSLKYERDTAEGVPATSGIINTLRLMGEANMGDDWSVYARLGAQYATQPSLADYNSDPVAYGDKKTVAALDQFGVIYKTNNIAYKLGRQDATIGATALLYSRPDTNIGKKVFVDGLSISGTVGKVDVSALLAQEDNAGSQDNRIYAVRASYNPAENLNWGLTLGRYQNNADGGTNHWSVDGTFKFAKNSITGEYTQSSSSVDNQAYAMTWNHDFDDKTAIYITNFRVEDRGDMGGQSDFDHGNRGWYYGITRKLKDEASLEIAYRDQQLINDGTKNTKLETTLSYSF